jgi:hypothetical protein
MSSSTDTVKNMDVNRRQCIKIDDPPEVLEAAGIKMKSFANYTRSSCLLECRAQAIFNACKCLPYYYPNFGIVWKENTTCDQNGLVCLSNINGKYQMWLLSQLSKTIIVDIANISCIFLVQLLLLSI